MIHFFCEGHEVTRQYLGIKLLTGLFLIDRRGSPTVDASVISVLISDLMYELQRTSRHFTFKFRGFESHPRTNPFDLEVSGVSAISTRWFRFSRLIIFEK